MHRSASLSATTRRSFSTLGERRGVSSSTCSCSSSQATPRYRRLCKPPSRAVVALGKFEALHLGHQQLAYRAVKSVEEDGGDTNGLSGAFLLRLRGVHAALRGQQKSAPPPSPFSATMPLVASMDRARVLGEWTHTLADPERGSGGGARAMPRVGVHECSLNFGSLRHLSPRSFVADVLHRELGAGAVVVGPDFRFGYKAEGDVEMLVSLCSELSIRVDVIDVLTTCAVPPVGDAAETTTSRVSSTRITESVQDGNMATTQALMGRKYRVVANCWTTTTATEAASRSAPRIHVDANSVCNLLPCPGKYVCSVMPLELLSPLRFSDSASVYEDVDEQHIIEPIEASISAGVDEGWRCTVLIYDNGCMEIIDDGRESGRSSPHIITNVGGQDVRQGLVQSIENLVQKRKCDCPGEQLQPVHLAIDFM